MYFLRAKGFRCPQKPSLRTCKGSLPVAVSAGVAAGAAVWWLELVEAAGAAWLDCCDCCWSLAAGAVLLGCDVVVCCAAAEIASAPESASAMSKRLFMNILRLEWPRTAWGSWD